MKITCCPSCSSSFTPVAVTAQGRARQSGSKCPLILKCGHTFCEGCLSQIVKKIPIKDTVKNPETEYKAKIACPICKRLTLLPSCIKDLPTNIYLTACIITNHHAKLEHDLSRFVPLPAKKLLQKSVSPDKSTTMDSGDNKCNMCQIKKACCECKECDNILCSECFNMVHKLSAAIRHHKPLPILQEKENLKKDTTCKDHNRPIEYFCTDDNTSICSRCYITGDHKQHAIVSFEEKNKHFIEQIHQELPVASAVLHHLKTIDKKILAAMPAFKTDTKALVEKINASFVNLHALLQAREIEMIDYVTTAYNNGLQTLEEKRVSFEQSKVHLETTLKEAKKLSENNALIIDAENILQKISVVKDIPCILVNDNLADSKCLQWQESGTAEILNAICKFGNIAGEMSEKVQFKTAEEAHIELVPDNDTESVSSLSSVMSNSDVLRSAGTLSRSSSIATDMTGDDVLPDSDDTDGDTGSTRSSKCNQSKLVRETINAPAVKGPPQKVVLTHINSPSSFYVQMVNNKKKLETLSHNMNIWCRSFSSSKHIPLTVEKNMMLLAKFSVDKQWYRARVLGVELPGDDKGKKSGLQVRVAYIDFGNEEVVGFKDLRIMQDRFMHYPEFKVHCSLFDIAPYDENSAWDAETIHEFQKLTADKVLTLNALARSIDALEVDLTYIPSDDVYDDMFVSVRDVLVFLELARLKHNSDQAQVQANLPSYSKADFISATVVKTDSPVPMHVSQASSPSDFHIVIRGEERDYYTSMMDQIQAKYNGDISKIYTLYYPRCGVMCVAKGEDGKWHRAKVLSAPVHKMVKVKLVDVGDVITVHYEWLRKLHTEFAKLPIQALECKLADVCPVEVDATTWSDETIHWCRTIMAKSVGTVRVVRWGSPAEILLWLGRDMEPLRDNSINSLLVTTGLASSSGPASVSLSSSSSGLPLQALVDRGYSKAPASPRKSRPSSSSSGSTITSPFKLNSPLLQSPASSPQKPKSPQKHEEASSGSTGSGKPHSKVPSQKNRLKLEKLRRQSGKQHKRLDDSPEGKKVVSAAAAASPSAKHNSKIQEEIHRAVSVEAGSGEADSQKKPMYIQVVMSHFSSPSDFRIRIQDKEEQLQHLMTALQRACKKEEGAMQTWSVGKDCAVRNPNDAKWYRGNIKSITEADIAEVELVDYGRHIEVVTSRDLKSLSAEFCKTECAAIRCYLGDLVPAGTSDRQKWSRTAIDFMAAQIFEKNLYVKLIGETSEDGVPVDIIIEEVIPETAFDPAIRSYHSLRHLILEDGLAMPSKHPSPDPHPDGVNPFLRTIFGQESDNTVKVEEKGVEEKGVDDSETQPDAVAQAEADTEEKEVVAREEMPVPKFLQLPEGPRPAIDCEIAVIPTYVGHDGIIYAQPTEWTDNIYHLSQELQRIYQDAVHKPVSWQVGQLCVAKFPDDDLWYRASILEMKPSVNERLKPSYFKVSYIDYGNTAWIPMYLLHEMCPEFAAIHLLAFRCVLNEAEPSSGDGFWPTPVLNHLHELVVNYECVITVHNITQDALILVSLTTDKGVKFPEYLFSKELAINAGDISDFYQKSATIGPVLTKNNPYQQLDMSEVGPEFRAIVTHVELPNVLYLQRLRIPESQAVDIVSAGEVAQVNNQIKEFEEMAEELNICTSMPFVTLPEVGLKLAGKYSLDNCWYRAVCVERYPASDSCLLVYVDFGTNEIVPRSNMRVLPTEFWTVPAQGIRCYFNIIPPQKHCGMFKSSTLIGVVHAITNKELLARVTQKSPLTVDLFEEQKKGELRLAYEELIVAGLALLPAAVNVASLLETSREANDDLEVSVELDEDDERYEVENDINTDQGSARVLSVDGKADAPRMSTGTDNFSEDGSVVQTGGGGIIEPDDDVQIELPKVDWYDIVDKEEALKLAGGGDSVEVTKNTSEISKREQASGESISIESSKREPTNGESISIESSKREQANGESISIESSKRGQTNGESISNESVSSSVDGAGYVDGDVHACTEKVEEGQ